MSILTWLKKKQNQESLMINKSFSNIEFGKNQLEGLNTSSNVLWTRCDYCGVILYIKHLKKQHHVCN